MLTPQEMEELKQLEAEESLASSASTSMSGLTPEEQAELAALEQEDLLASQPLPPERRTGEAFAQGFGNAATFGYLPQIQAATEPIIQGALDMFGGDGVDEKLRAEGFQIENAPEQSYVDRRDQYIRQGESLASENPLASGVGELGGSIISGIATGGALGPAKAAGLGQRFLQAGKAGALVGAIANPGDTEGQVDPYLQLGDRAENAALGGAFSLGTQGLGELAASAGKMIRKAPGTLEKVSKEMALRALGPGAKELKKIKKVGADDVIETLQKNGIIEVGDNVETIMPKLSKFADQAGDELDQAYDDVVKITKSSTGKSLTRDESRLLRMASPDGKKIALDAEKQIKNSLKNDAAGKVTDSAQTAINKLKDNPEMSLKDLREIKTNLDRDIRYPSLDKNSSDQQKQLKIVRDMVAKQIDQIAESAGSLAGKGSDLSKAIKAANKKYSHAATARDVVEGQVDRNLKNQYFSLTDKIIGSAGIAGTLASSDSPEDMVKSGLFGIASAIASKNARKYGAPVASRAAKRLAEAMKTPAYFAKYGKPLIEAAKISPEKFNAVLATYGNDPKLEKAVMDPSSFDEKYRGPAKSK